MARKRKNRTHLKGGPASGAESSNAPKSFVIKHGQVGTSLTQLVRDVRKVMEPNTASRLKVGIFSFLVYSNHSGRDSGHEMKRGRRMLTWVSIFLASEGTGPKQAERFLNYGPCAPSDASARVHTYGRRSVAEDRQALEWADAQFQDREV